MKRIPATVSFMLSAIMLASLVASPGRAIGSGNPDFDAVPWMSLGCTAGDAVNDVNPATTDLVGNATFPVAYSAHDSTYLYFRYRLNVDPLSAGNFDQFAWVALMQTPAGNPFQYQYLLSMNGKGGDDNCGNTGGNKGDTIEIWANNPASSITFSPIFNDPADTQLYAQKYDYSGACTGGNPPTVNSSPLARTIAASDGSNFGGNGDFFLDFAFPISVLISKGVISSGADIDNSLFYVATSANANNYNKDQTDCRFLPPTTLSISKTASPTTLPVNTTTALSYTIVVQNTGTASAHGVVIKDPALAAYMTSPTVNVPPTRWRSTSPSSWSVGASRSRSAPTPHRTAPTPTSRTRRPQRP